MTSFEVTAQVQQFEITADDSPLYPITATVPEFIISAMQ